jgi:hypothetical protein
MPLIWQEFREMLEKPRIRERINKQLCVREALMPALPATYASDD